MTNRDPYPGKTPSEQALEDRRQNAREAALDCVPPGYYLPSGVLDGAIETATRVQITPEVIRAFIEAPDDWEEGDIAGPLRAAFAAAGLEVVE